MSHNIVDTSIGVVILYIWVHIWCIFENEPLVVRCKAKFTLLVKLQDLNPANMKDIHIQ